MTLMLYAVTPATTPTPERPGVGRAALQRVEHATLAVVVSEAPQDLLARRRDVMAFMDVLDELLAHGPVLPFRFGTTVPDLAAAEGMLTEREGALLQRLDRLDGAVEVTLRVRRELAAAVRAALGADPGLHRMQQRSRRTGAYADQLALGEGIAAAVQSQDQRDRATVLRRVQPLALEAVESDPAGDDEVVALSLLVSRDRLDEVDAAVTALGESLQERLRIDYAGPLPPYSFAG